MQIPSFAQPHWSAYQASGQLSGASDRLELGREAAQQALTSLKDEFQHWQSLDETDADLMKGQPGAVRVASGYSPCEYREALGLRKPRTLEPPAKLGVIGLDARPRMVDCHLRVEGRKVHQQLLAGRVVYATKLVQIGGAERA